MTSYNAIVELDTKPTPALAGHLLDTLTEYHPAVAQTSWGRLELILTVPAETLAQAAQTALAVVAAAPGTPRQPNLPPATAIQILTTDDYDRQNGLEPIPELASVTEAAHQLHITRQAVLKRIDTGTLPAQRVGTTYAIPRAALTDTPPNQH